MSRKARESAASKSLLQHVESRSTGRISVGAPAARLFVWLLAGEVVAATSAMDETALVRLAALAGALDADAAAQLEQRIEHGESVFGALLEQVPGDLIERLLADRFRSNLAEFLGSMSRPSFTALESIFVDNIQLGHDSRALITEAAAIADSAGAIDLSVELVRGLVAPEDALGQACDQQLLQGPATAAAVLAGLPWEPVLAKAWLQQALDKGVVAIKGSATEEDEDWAEDDATEHDESPRSAPPISASPEAADDSPTADTAGGHEALPPGTTLLGLAVDDGERTDDTPSPMLPDQIATVRSWLSKAHAVEADELDFFEDHDTERRGGSEDGSFSTDLHNLEKVEVSIASSDLEEVLEADEAPATRYSAPTIGEDEAAGKVAVTNAVLSTIREAFDRSEGPGRGRAAFQLLIEGAPPKYQTVFDGVQVAEGGTLPPGDVVSNLLARPATEQRLLLNQALSDLIDRALSTAADELPDDEIDNLLEHTAGFRSRLGL